jgi:hypothetical protein
MELLPENQSPIPSGLTQRIDLADRVAGVITRKAKIAGISDVAYFREIMAGRVPRITRAEAAEYVGDQKTAT